MDNVEIDSTVTENSSNLITSGAVYQAINILSNKLTGSLSFSYVVYSSNKYSGRSYVNTLQTTYLSDAYTINKTLSGDVNFTCDYYSPGSSKKSTDTSSKTGYYPQLQGFACNLSGTGIITIQMGAFSNSMSSSSYVYVCYDGDVPSIVFNVEDGTITNISYNFIVMGNCAYYPGAVVVKID